MRPIRLINVRQNNLKNITVQFPAKQLSVVTGVSGSGKSSLAFDTLYAEGQRRYIESLSTYARQFLEKMPKPDLDAVENIPPAIALEQRNHVTNSRSTVATQTEIADYMRVLFARVGKISCIKCESPVERSSPQNVASLAMSWLPGRKAAIAAPVTLTGRASKKSTIQYLREQGFGRVLFKDEKNRVVVVDITGDITGDINDTLLRKLDPSSICVVIDRIKLGKTPDQDSCSRVLDSVEQAWNAAAGRVHFVDLATGDELNFAKGLRCTSCAKEYREPEPNLFSFNSPIGACQHCSGFGFTLELAESLVVPDPSKTIKNGAIDPLSKPSMSEWQADMFRFVERHGISIGKRYSELKASERKLLWYGHPGDKTFPGIIACFEQLKRWKYKLHVRVFIRRYQSQVLCAQCNGTRLNADALAVKIGGKAISDVCAMSIQEASFWLKHLELSASDRTTANEPLVQIERRLALLEDIGVGYLTLSRAAKTLSGGEFQRLNIATQLGNGLCGTLYVLDEPSIGLHPSDNKRLIAILKKLRDQGNTVVVVEHDLDVMREANWLIELGPLAGSRGGEMVAQGPPEALIEAKGSLTGKYLSGAFRLSRDRPEAPPARKTLRITGCSENNLKNIDVEIPLERFVVATGVSGSGKTTLVHKTLYNALARLFYRSVGQSAQVPGRFDRLYGAEALSGVIMLDQSPIGKTSRSNPATYMKLWDEVRRIYANQIASVRRGYTTQHFSFNIDGGRCPICKGEGEIRLDMHFMAEIRLPCEECRGERFKKSILDVLYRSKNIAQLLRTTIDDAYSMFLDNPVLSRKLAMLREVGLGYLHLGQSAITLSGGECQRLKIASALDDRSRENLLYIFDEPTTGLHHEDIKKLLSVVHDLVALKNSVLMIEHNIDVIAQSDWIIDLGPGGGLSGGAIVATGPPRVVAAEELSKTGNALSERGLFFPGRL